MTIRFALELAATAAGQGLSPSPGLETPPRSVSGLAPMAASLEVTPWISTAYEVPITL